MIRISTGSRLHFGLFQLPAIETDDPPNVLAQTALPSRRFGGVGLMVELPGVQVAVSAASAWSAEGPVAERALAFARRYAETSSEVTTPCHIAVERCAAEHVGLGTGTQLGLAVAKGIDVVSGQGNLDPVALARRVGRGVRSALGIHGFAKGGFLVEAGQRQPGAIAPLAARVAFPESWRIVLVLPPWGTGLHGNREMQVFTQLPPQPATRTDALCRLVLLGMLPALSEEDIEAFGESLHEFNARAGEAFAAIQGGTYSSARIEELIGFVRAHGVRGVGQSSWGPGLFAVVGDVEQGEELAAQLRQRFFFAAQEVLVTRPRNQGAFQVLPLD